MGQENRSLKLVVDGIVTDLEPYRQVFRQHGVHLSTYFLQYNYADNTTQLNFVVLAPSHRNYLPMFEDMRELRPTRSLILTAQE